MYHKQFKNYRTAESSSASKLIQVAILLENCGQLLQKASLAIEEKKYEERYILIDKVMLILSAIQDILATDKSTMAKNLNTYFQKTITLLVQVNMQEDVTICNLVRERLIDMAQIWREADRTLITQMETSISTSSQGISGKDNLEISA